MAGDVCKACGLTHDGSVQGNRRDLGIKVSEEEKSSMELLNSRLNAVEQALNPRNLDADATQEQVDRFVNSLVRTKGDIQFLQRDWWNGVIAKYCLGSYGDVHLDFADGSLFVIDLA